MTDAHGVDPVQEIEWIPTMKLSGSRSGNRVDPYGEIRWIPKRKFCNQLDKVQRGGQPDDFKPMPSIGNGVEEIRVWDDSGTYRVIYTARLADEVFVLHAFQKKTQATAKRDIDIAKERFVQLMRGRK